MTRLRISTPARRDLREISSWLADRDPRAADSAVRRLRRALDDAAAHPRIGHRREDLLGESDLLVLSVAPWLVVYRPGPDHVAVVRILHSARDLPSALRGEDPSEE
jgi:plasmid stabilization system protein ParE